MSKRTGPPKHQNSYAWKPNLGRKINETEPGAGSGLCRRSPASASSTGTKSIRR
uniref:Predicted protein n=1 Tax=Hordeum vulgare subsp. vulgare TaxID=112509 RepID=F2DYT1_HORVV|nr:predicted protein [Hordeum vulgare subsp. vulgare]